MASMMSVPKANLRASLISYFPTTLNRRHCSRGLFEGIEVAEPRVLQETSCSAVVTAYEPSRYKISSDHRTAPQSPGGTLYLAHRTVLARVRAVDVDLVGLTRSPIVSNPPLVRPAVADLGPTRQFLATHTRSFHPVFDSVSSTR